MKTSNFTLRFLLVSFFSLQALMLCSQISDFGFDPIFGSPEPFYGEVYLYMPDNNNSITIREKSDLKFSFDRKLNPNLHDGITRVEPLDVTANNFRLSYSPVRHLYGTASLLMIGGGENLSSYDSKMTQGDIGIGGYYLKEFGNVFKKKNILNKTTAGMMQKKGLLVNALLGYGRGIIHHQLTWRSGLGEFRLNKFYGQVGFDYQARLWGFAGTARIGIINYGLTYLEGHAPAFLKAPMNLLADKNNFNFSEVSFRIYVGMKFGQIYLKGVRSKTDEELTRFVLPGYFNVGAVLNIQEFFKKKNKDEK